MSYASERQAIEEHWLSLWVKGSPPVPRTETGLLGIKFDPATGVPWARLTIINGEARQVSMGSPGANTVRHVGTIMVNLFYPMPVARAGELPSRAARELAEMADAAAAVWRNASFGGIQCFTPYVTDTVVDGAWLRSTVVTPFWRDEHL